MSVRSAFKSLASRPLAAALLIVLLLAASATELGRLLDRRHALGQRTQVNLDEAQAATDAHALVALQADAVRDLVLATTPEEIGDTERRFEALLRRYDDAQDVLLARFVADPETTATERALLAKVTREHLATIQPVERVVTLARHNEDAAATRILVEEALPHETELQGALVDLGALQAAQNRALASGSDTRSLEMALVGVLGMLAALLALTVLRLATRAGPRATAFAAQAAGLDAGRAASNDDLRLRVVAPMPAVDPARDGAASLGLSAAERARALTAARTGGPRTREVGELVD